MNRILSIALLFLTGLVNIAAQSFNLSKLTNVQGLPQNYVYSIVQDRNGYVWIGLAEGLAQYDGIKFTNYTTRDSLSDNYVSRMLIDTDGNLWCGHGNGRFSVNIGGRFYKIQVDDVASPIKDMCLDDKGYIWAVEQNKGLLRVSPDRQVRTYFDRELFGRRVFCSVKAVNSMTLIVGTSDGALLVKVAVDGSIEKVEDIDDLPCSSINCIEKTKVDGEYLVGTDEGEIYRYSLVNGARKLQHTIESCSSAEESYDIRKIYESDNGDLFIGTWGSGLKQWRPTSVFDKYSETLSLSENNGLDNNYISDIIKDREGVYWFGTYGAGVVVWINNYFAQYDLSEIGLQRCKVSSAAADSKNLWIGLNVGLVRMDKQCMSKFDIYDANQGLPRGASITSICVDEARGVQYVATDMSGVYTRKLDGRNFRALYYAESSHTSEMVNDMAFDDSNLYLATQGGFVVYDLKSQTSKCYTTVDGLPHNNINFVYIDDDGQVWLGAKDSGITMYLQEGKFETHRLSEIPIDVAGMAVDERNRFWLATASNGVICTSNDSIVSITTADGLEKNYCYGISADQNQRIWVCHQPGLSCIDLNTGNIRTFNLANGVGQEFNGVYADQSGDLWFSSSTGIIHYISQYDKRNSVSPIINLSKVVVAGKKRNVNDDIILPYPYDGDVPKLEFDFIGICMKDPANVRYEYWMEVDGNPNERWNPLGTQSHKEFEFLPDGDHVLHVRAFNSDGIVCGKPLKIKIHIDAPFWKSFLFPIVLLILVVVIARVFSRWREKKMRHRQLLLEAEVNKQTIALREQKGEIERKNRDIMDSINYAKRIQSAILPSQDGLQDFAFAESFILFMPRDVVSGDFYWFSKYDNKLLLCCGDCTGHGVPGAFMSMIGAALLNDATHEVELRHPARLIEKLDKEIKATLNKNQTIDAQDGMDCAIIEFDFDTLEACSAAARRPVYIYSKGRLNEIKGTRRGVGEHRNSNEFVETTTQLHKGDVLYLSSDGFASQLPGDDNLKGPYTAGALKRFLEQIVNLPMSEQKEALEKEFKTYRGSCEQIDDVIIIGIRI